MAKRSCCIAIFVLVLISGLNSAWADNEGLGEKLATWELVRVIELLEAPHGRLGPLFAGSIGDDAIARGQISVRRKGEIEISLRGAPAGVRYTVTFCRSGYGPVLGAGCVELGAIETDAKGVTRARMAFATPAQAWTGTFLLSSADGAWQFAGGFRFPPAGEISTQDGSEVKLEGAIAVFNADGSFQIAGLPVNIFVGASTRFEGVTPETLAVGLVVEVKGFTRPDNTIFATKVEAEEDDGGEDKPGRGLGRDKDKKDKKGN